MILSFKHKFIFIKTKKVGGSSVETYLKNFILPGELYPNPVSKKEEKGGLFNHVGIKGVERTEFAKYLDEFFVFTVVRHPMERLISEYFWSERNNTNKTDFDTYLRNRNLDGTNNWPLLVNDNHQLSGKFNFFIRNENLINDLNKVLSLLRLETIKDTDDFPREKSTERTDKRPWYEFMNSDQMVYFYNNYPKEIKIHRELGYKV